MNPKKQTKLAHKLVAVNFILIECLDELNATTPEMQEYKNSLLKIGDLLIKEINDTPAIQRSTYFQMLSNKVDTVIRKELDVNM
jgi:hypothetical protein